MADSINLEPFLGMIPLVAAGVTIARNRWEKRKLQQELFDKFNKRFDELNEALNDIRSCSLNQESLTSLYTLPSSPTKERKWRDVVQDYLNLCSEEYLWRKKGLIDNDIWEAWQDGILFYLEADCFKEVFTCEASRSKSYYGLFSSLQRAGWSCNPNKA